MNMVYYDKLGHLVADTLEELQVFARALGLKPEWYQAGRHPHYDLTTPRMVAKARRRGAILVSPRELVKISWRL